MIVQRGFYHSSWNPNGPGIENQFELRNKKQVVYDAATGLTWQQSGSLEEMNYEKAQEYIETLNREKHADYDDWRLPTLEQAMSLMEPKKNEHGLYIDPIFDRKQRWIWTADKVGAWRAWDVYFDAGYCDVNVLGFGYFVRAVC